MPTMILTKACKVGGERRAVGHRFDVPEKEARLWVALGRAKPARETQRGSANAAAATSGDGAPRYNRRDMRAEG
jgi:hypothetical protein